MKIYRDDSHKFIKIKELIFQGSIVKKLVVGTIILEALFFQGSFINGNNYTSALPKYNNTIVAKNYNSNISTTPITISSVTTQKANIQAITQTASTGSSAITVQEEKKMVALSYDDGPAKDLTLELLKILKDNNCTATFFVLGNRVKQYSDIIKQVHSAGNEIGNHSYDHSDFTKLSDVKMKKQIKDTNAAVYKITDEYPTLFRPPYGAYNKNVKAAVNCPIILWAIDSNDWRSISDEKVIDNIMSELADGKIILMHDIHKRTIKVSKIVIPKIKGLGYNIVSISELFKVKNEKLEKGHVYTKTKKN